MTKPAEYLLYRVTRTEETYPSASPVHLGLPDLDVRKYPRLKEVHPFFGEELWFEVGQTRQLPLTEEQARQQRSQRWKVERRGHGRPVNDGERGLIAFCEQRHAELEAARDRIYSFTSPYGDYVRAGLVGRYLKTARVTEDLDRLKASGIVTEELAADMGRVVDGLHELRVVDRLLELRSDLEAKGWQFNEDGTVEEPPTRGRPARYPRSAIRSYYRLLGLLHMGSGAQDEVIQVIRRELEPHFGSLAPDEIREAIKYELKRPTPSTPPIPQPSE